MAERGVEVDASWIWRWVQTYAPELNKRCRPYLKPVNKSYRIDETYIKVKSQDKYLYRTLDPAGKTIDFLLTAKRDTADPGISGCSGSAESRRRHSPPGRFTPVQIS